MERASCRRGPRLRPGSDERWGYRYIPQLDDEGRPTRVVSERGKEYRCSSAVVRRRCDAVGRSVSARGQIAFSRRHYATTWASAASVWGSQNVISIDWYISMAVDNSVRASSRWPVAAYRVPRPWWQWAWRWRMPSSSARARARW